MQNAPTYQEVPTPSMEDGSIPSKSAKQRNDSQLQKQSMRSCSFKKGGTYSV